jgi:hypothetical protein
VPRLATALYKAVYGSKKRYGPAFRPLGRMRGRYLYASLDVPDAEKRFNLAVPIPDGVTDLVQAQPEVAQVWVEVWPAETVAEVVHTGPYATEPETLRSLYEHVDRQGYQIVGPHEEEYLSGPGTPDARRRTILRYAVARTGPAGDTGGPARRRTSMAPESGSAV